MKPNVGDRVFIEAWGRPSHPGTVTEVRDPDSDTWPNDDSVAWIEFDHGVSAWFEAAIIHPCEVASCAAPSLLVHPGFGLFLNATPNPDARKLTVEDFEGILRDVWEIATR